MKILMALAATGAALAAPVAPALAQNSSKQDRIDQAVLAAPRSLRAGATVVTYDAKGDPVVLRRGSNDIFCTPNNPNGKLFSVHCYANALRAQQDMQAKEKAEGKDPATIRADIQAAQRADKIPDIRLGTTMYSLTGKTEASAKGMWVILMPGMTAAETNLPTKPTSQGTPWLMRQSTPAAHIHIPQHGATEAM